MRKAQKVNSEPRRPEQQRIEWSHLVGFAAAEARISALIGLNRLPPILMFYGRASIGKSSFAAKVAAIHYCYKRTGCGECAECLLIKSQQHPEVLWIDSKGAALKVADAELVLEHLSVSPQSHSQDFGGIGRPVRMVVIADIDVMNDQGINRLLKAFEEPSEYVQVILTTSRMNAVLPTLLSRCVKWHLPPPPLSESLATLKQLCDPQILAEYTDVELGQLLRRHGLSLGKALLAVDPQKKSEEFHELCRMIAHPDRVFTTLELAEEISATKAGVDSIAHELELVMNQLYRQEFLGARSHRLRHENLLMRRTLLRQAKHFAGRRRINMNAQLFAEAIGLSEFGISDQ